MAFQTGGSMLRMMSASAMGKGEAGHSEGFEDGFELGGFEFGTLWYGTTKWLMNYRHKTKQSFDGLNECFAVRPGEPHEQLKKGGRCDTVYVDTSGHCC